VEGFTALQIDKGNEKRAMRRILKEREKQIKTEIENTIDMYNSIKGIGGKAIPSVKALELPAPGELSLNDYS
jgi:hypothetical protein